LKRGKTPGLRLQTKKKEGRWKMEEGRRKMEDGRITKRRTRDDLQVTSLKPETCNL
jgi:hypothetical protein